MAVRTHEILLDGGLDQLTPVLKIGEGHAIAARNYELKHEGGYRRIDGYEPYDGQTEPQTATYYSIKFDSGAVEPPANVTITQPSQGDSNLLSVVVESGSYADQDATGYLNIDLPIGGFFDVGLRFYSEDDNYVSNGTFDSATGWTQGAGWSIAAGVASATAATGNLSTTSIKTLTAGVNYRVVYNISNYSAGDVAISVGGDAGTTRSSNGTFTEDFDGLTASDQLIEFIPGTAFTGDIDVVAVYPYYFEATDTMKEQDATLPTDHEFALAAAADVLRASIAAVPGSGPVRGVFYFDGKTYALRDNTGGTALDMWRADTNGWNQVGDFSYRLDFTSGGTAELMELDVIEQGAVSATVRRVVVESGTWGGGDAAGYIIHSSPSGGNFSAGDFDQQGGQANIGTAAGAEALVTIANGGRVEVAVHNFFGASDLQRVYFVTGQDTAFEYDGSHLVPIETGMPTDTPNHIAVFAEHLFLTFPGGSVQHSAPGAPLTWSAVLGANELGLGQECVGLQVLAGSGDLESLAVFGRNTTKVLYGTSVSDWQFNTLYREQGGIEWSFQQIGRPIYLDDRGVAEMNETDRFANFAAETIVREVFKFVKPLKNNVVASAVSYDKNQWRLYFDAPYELFANTEFLADIDGFDEHSPTVQWASARLQLIGGVGQTPTARTALSTIKGTTYTVNYEITSISADDLEFRVGSTPGGTDLADETETTTGNKSFTFTASGDVAYVEIEIVDTGANGTVVNLDNFSCLQPRTKWLEVTYKGADEESGAGVRGAMTGEYPIDIFCSLSGEDNSGNEHIYVGAEDGFVYRLDVGRSFGGTNIEAYLRTAFTHIRNPQRIKRFRSAVFDMVTGPSADIRVIPEYDYGDPDQPAHEELIAFIEGGGAAWDEDNWNQFYWAQLISEGLVGLEGSGINLSLVFYSNTRTEEPHEFNGIVYNYSDRRLRRAS